MPLSHVQQWVREKRFWIYGRHATSAALTNPERHCWRLLATMATAEAMTGIITQVRASGRFLPPLEVVDPPVIEAIAPWKVHQGMAVQVSPLTPLSIEAISAHTGGRTEAVVVVLDKVTDPYNVGAVVRSAAAFGALAIVMQERHAPVETGTLARAASGGLERVRLVRVVNITRALETLKTAGFWVIGLDATVHLSMPHVQIPDRIALVLGSEGRGLRRLVRTRCDILLRLPMVGAMESLNVSNAAAIALYEITYTRVSGLKYQSELDK